jgi:hypothetical protein
MMIFRIRRRHRASGVWFWRMRESSSHLRFFARSDEGFGLSFEDLKATDFIRQFGDGTRSGGLINQRFFQVLLLLGVEVVVVFRNVG